jgi:hypothetical protein
VRRKPAARDIAQDSWEARGDVVPVLEVRQRACAPHLSGDIVVVGKVRTGLPLGDPSGVPVVCTAYWPGTASCSASTAAMQAGSSDGVRHGSGAAQTCSTSAGDGDMVARFKGRCCAEAEKRRVDAIGWPHGSDSDESKQGNSRVVARPGRRIRP